MQNRWVVGASIYGPCDRSLGQVYRVSLKQRRECGRVEVLVKEKRNLVVLKFNDVKRIRSGDPARLSYLRATFRRHFLSALLCKYRARPTFLPTFGPRCLFIRNGHSLLAGVEPGQTDASVATYLSRTKAVPHRLD